MEVIHQILCSIIKIPAHCIQTRLLDIKHCSFKQQQKRYYWWWIMLWFDLGPSKVSIISPWKEKKKSHNYNAIKHKLRGKVVFKMPFKIYKLVIHI